MLKNKMGYYVYIVRCDDNTLYTGITTELERRVYEHNYTNKGAKYTRSRRPVELVYFEDALNRSEACRREYEIKKMSRRDKLTLFDNLKSDLL